MKRHGEWIEANKLTKRVRDCMSDGSSLSDREMPEAVSIVIWREFGVEYTPDEVLAIFTGRGVESKR